MIDKKQWWVKHKPTTSRSKLQMSSAVNHVGEVRKLQRLSLPFCVQIRHAWRFKHRLNRVPYFSPFWGYLTKNLFNEYTVPRFTHKTSTAKTSCKKVIFCLVVWLVFGEQDNSRVQVHTQLNYTRNTHVETQSSSCNQCGSYAWEWDAQPFL